MKRNLITCAIAAAFALPVVAADAQKAQQQKPAAATAAQPAAILASDLIGKKVVNSQGQDLGEVQDLAVDLRNNRVAYAMLDAQNKMFAYPLRQLKLSGDGDRIVLNVSEERLEQAPGMDRSRRGDRVAGDDAYWRDADRYWRSGERAAQEQAAPRLVWGSKLVGWNVHTRDNTDSIGEVKDLVIDPNTGAVKFAAVDFNDKIGGRDAAALADRLQPLPLDAFATREGGDDLVLAVDRAKLQAAHGFDEDRLDERMTDRAFIDKAARYADALTPATRVGSAR